MRNSLILMCGLLMISVSANACGGITVMGNSGVNYCMSKYAMNWYSAYAWCQGQGKNLMDLETVCGRISGNCGELRLSSDEQNKVTSNGGTVGWVWSNTSYSSSVVYAVSLSSGNFNANHSRNHTAYALCF